MAQVNLRKLTTADLLPLQEISRKTFHDTFAAVNTPENMEAYLKDSLSTEKLSTELADPHSEFWFAEQEGRPIGYLKINFAAAQTELKDSKALEIERIYVLQEFQGLKLGQLLFEKALAVAREAGAEYVWLGVWEENSKAIGFYKRNGFVEFGKHVFMLGDDAQTDIMMKLPLK